MSLYICAFFSVFFTVECYGLKSRQGLSKTNLKQEELRRLQNRCYVLRFREAKASTSHAQREARVTRVAPSSVASPANVLRGSSRVPFPLVSEAGTRYETLRTSAGEATSSCACLRVSVTVNSRHLKFHRCYSIS